jgi:aspartyl-tRNA(Asn)/glutamyl-tRNA(Gln) amidotransferase subunit A
VASPNIRELLYKSIDEISTLYRKKEISPVEIMEATLERLEELEPSLNAFITVLAEESLAEARKAETVFQKGESVGRLLGIPVSVKDIFNTKGIRTTAGSRIMRDYVPNEDSYVVKALREAGAIIFGKTNMLEFAFGFVHPDYGKCCNPWDLNRTAGGSSTGSGSSVAAGIGFGSIGTDTGGSTRAPGSFCGIIGFKPTVNLIPKEGLFPLSDTLDHVGSLTRTVQDNAILLESITSSRFDFASVFSGNIQGIKVGVLRSLTDNLENKEIESLTLAAIDMLRELGAIVVDAVILDIEIIEEIAIPILTAEASKNHKMWYPHRESDYAASTFNNVKAGFDVSAVRYLAALDQRRKFTESVNEALSNVDALVLPTFSFTATVKDPSFEDGNYDISSRTLPFNVSGHPALTISAGNTASENLPVGFQIVGRYYDEAIVYRVAHALQTASGGFKQPPL